MVEKNLTLDQGEQKQGHRLTNNIKSGYIKVSPTKTRIKTLIKKITLLKILFFVHQYTT